MRILLPALTALLVLPGLAADKPQVSKQAETSVQEFEREAKRELKELRVEIDELKGAIERQERHMKRLHERREKLEKRVGEGRDAAAGEWERFKERFHEEMADLREDYEELKERLSD